MKNLTLSLIFVLAVLASFGQKNWVPFTGSQAQTPDVTVVQSNSTSITFDISISGMYSEPMVREGKFFQRISLIENQTTKEIGRPELPMLHQLIGIPDNKFVSFVISEVQTMTLTGYNIFPFQTPTTDNPGGHSHAFVMDKNFYQKSVNYPEVSVTMDQPQIWRDVRVSGIHVTPFTYNPARQELTVITHMKVKVEFSGFDSKNFISRSKEISPKFYNMYKKAIVNFDDLGYNETLRETPGIKYLVITNTQALNAIQPLVDFKNKQGLKVEVKVLETGFTTPQHFKTYITELFNSDDLEYVLMVGDAYPNGGSGGGPNIVPMYYWAPGGEDPSYSDSWYTCLNGADDHYADLAIGRFVYDNNQINELELQIEKTMTHYLSPDASDNWAENTILIAHKEEYPGKYTLCCEQIRTYPYSVQVPIFETAYGGAGATNQQVIDFVNNTACGIFNYRGHGSTTELWQWGATGSFTATHVAQLNNVDKLFVFFDVCCDNMDIVAYNGECLCESFMKHPTASVAVNGAIIPSYTIPNHDYDKEMYKAVFDEDITPIGYVTNFANVTVLNVHGNLGRSNVRTYLWLGDASIEPWTYQPANMTVSHDSQLFLGVSEFSVQVTGNSGALANAMVCVSNADGSIYAVAYTDATGLATVTFDGPVQTPGDATVMVTKHNYLPYQDVIPVIPQSGPYVVKDSYTINDVTGGNGNGLMDYGESVLLSLSVKNVGVQVAENVVVTLSTTDEYITITDNTENYGNIQPNQILTIADGFAFDVAQTIPEGHAVLFEVSATNGTDVWVSNLVIIGHAPLLNFASYTINDASGNNNGFLDPGETVTMTVNVENNGTASAYNVMGLLSTTDPYVSVLTTAAQSFGNMDPAVTKSADYQVTAAANTPFGYTAQLTISLTADFGISQQDVLEISFEDYCDASTSVEDEYIMKVVCGEINNTSGWQGGVANYTNISVTLEPGVAMPITVTNGNAWASDIVYVWVDWNLNKTLGDPGETFMLTNVGGTGQTFTGNITAPANQNAGTYRMRVRMTYSTAPTPCGAATYGEVEDYTVVIEGGVNANFTANVTSLCENGQVQFTDNSTGGATSWAWEFPGGTPASSTEQNPVVTYTTAGVYDVTLEVSNGTQTHSLTRPAYITVMTEPAQAGPISGDNVVGIGEIETYTVTALAYCSQYDWVLTPNEAGSMLVSMNNVTITWSSTWTGTATLKVCGGNICGMGPYSEEFEVMVSDYTGMDQTNAANLEIYPNPTAGNITLKLNTSDKISVKVINAIGKVVYEQNTIEINGFYSTNIDLTNVAEGIYYLKLEGNKINTIEKIVITR